jgi:hypothetical protein
MEIIFIRSHFIISKDRKDFLQWPYRIEISDLNIVYFVTILWPLWLKKYHTKNIILHKRF